MESRNSSGRFAFAWSSSGQDGSGLGIYGKLFQLPSSLGVEFPVNGSTWNSQALTDVAMTSEGDFVPMWVSNQDADNSYSIFMRRYFFPVSLLVAPGPDPGFAAETQAYQPEGSSKDAPFTPYGTGAYGATVGAGDVDGDGLAEALTGPGPSPVFGPHVRAFERDGVPLAKVSFYAYGTLRYGVKESGASIDLDPYAEILTTPGPGEVFGPHVRGFDYDGTRLVAISKVSFFAYGTLRWGAESAGGDINGDGIHEILTGPGPGVIFGPQLRGFDYDGTQVRALAKVNGFVFPTGGSGLTVGAADTESDGVGGYGDGFQEILAGRGPDPNGNASVMLLDYDANQLQPFYQVTPFTSRYGARTAGGDVDAGDVEEVVAAPGPDPAAPARVRSYEWDPVIGQNPYGPALRPLGPDDFVAFSSAYGANIAVGTFE